jgi:hypothetical protein
VRSADPQLHHLHARLRDQPPRRQASRPARQPPGPPPHPAMNR